MDNYSFALTTFSSFASFYTFYASTKCYSIASSSFHSSMNTKSTDVAHGFVCSLTCQRLLLLRKNSTIDVLIVFMSWIIVYANCIFSLYAFPSTHSEDDNECVNNLIANNWIFNTLFLSIFFNSSSTSILFNNYASSSCLCLCSLLHTSPSLAILCSF
jgi:hypothetical protein